MRMRYSIRSQKILLQAGEIARSFGHGYVGSAHLLLAMVRQKDETGSFLQSVGVQAKLTEQMASILYGVGTPGLPLPQGFSGQMRKILRAAGWEARFQRCPSVEPGHMLLAMLRQETSAAKELLILNGVNTEELFSMGVENLRWKQS